MKRDPGHELADKILSKQDLELIKKEWKDKSRKVVFTNGCFDIVHPGHLSYLSEAASYGDVLVVGLNTDRSVKELKGANRPINDEFSRAQLLASMFFIDAVVLFDEETPADLINLLEPDVLVKGGDYTIDTIVGAKEVLEKGGEVKVLGFLPGYSSTSIIEKIRKS